MGSDLEGVFAVGGEDGGCDAPLGFARLGVRLEVAVAYVAAAGGAEETLGCGLWRVDVPRERRVQRGWRDKLGLDVLGQGGVEAAEGPVSVPADAAVAEMYRQGKSRGGNSNGEPDRLAVASSRERLVCCCELVGEVEIGGHAGVL